VGGGWGEGCWQWRGLEGMSGYDLMLPVVLLPFSSSSLPGIG
jgi:hypothetical protein